MIIIDRRCYFNKLIPITSCTHIYCRRCPRKFIPFVSQSPRILERNFERRRALCSMRLVPSEYGTVRASPLTPLHVSAFLNIPTELSRLPSITSTTDHVARLLRPSVRISRYLCSRKGWRSVANVAFFNIDPPRSSVSIHIHFPPRGRSLGYSWYVTLVWLAETRPWNDAS